MKNSTRNKSLLGLVAAMLLTCANSFAQYTDRTAFNLNGVVKSVVCKNEGCVDDGPVPYSTITFTRAGKVATCDGVKLNYYVDSHVDRNSKGYLSAYSAYGASGHCAKAIYTYNAQGRIATTKNTFDGKVEDIAKHTYDANGNLTKQGKTVYTILKKDSHGNWLSRRYKNEDGETVNDSRTITYYE